MTPSMAEKLIRRELAPLVKRIEKLETAAALASTVEKRNIVDEPVGWGNHLPGKIEP